MGTMLPPRGRRSSYRGPLTFLNTVGKRLDAEMAVERASSKPQAYNAERTRIDDQRP